MAFLLLIALLLLIMLQPPGRRGILRAAIWMGVLIVAFVEFLSLFKWLTSFGLAITWGGAILFLLGWHVSHRWESVASWWKWLAVRQFPKDWPTRLLLAGILIMILAVGTMAFLTPVQTPDSQTYHLSRVAHWAQDHSVGIYATGIERQNFMSPYAEFAVLNLYVLQGGDTFVNIPNFLVYLGNP